MLLQYFSRDSVTLLTEQEDINRLGRFVCASYLCCNTSSQLIIKFYAYDFSSNNVNPFNLAGNCILAIVLVVSIFASKTSTTSRAIVMW